MGEQRRRRQRLRLRSTETRRSIRFIDPSASDSNQIYQSAFLHANDEVLGSRPVNPCRQIENEIVSLYRKSIYIAILIGEDSEGNIVEYVNPPGLVPPCAN